MVPEPIRRYCSLHDHSPRSGCCLVLQCLAAASLVSAEGGVVPWTVLLRKCALGWTNEQRATAEFADGAFVSSVGIRRQAMPGPAVMPQSARLLAWVAVNLSAQPPAGQSSPSLTTTGSMAATSVGQELHGRHYRIRVACEVCAFLWRRLVNRRFDLSHPALFLLSNDRFFSGWRWLPSVSLVFAGDFS